MLLRSTPTLAAGPTAGRTTPRWASTSGTMWRPSVRCWPTVAAGHDVCSQGMLPRAATLTKGLKHPQMCAPAQPPTVLPSTPAPSHPSSAGSMVVRGRNSLSLSAADSGTWVITLQLARRRSMEQVGVVSDWLWWHGMCWEAKAGLAWSARFIVNASGLPWFHSNLQLFWILSYCPSTGEGPHAGAGEPGGGGGAGAAALCRRRRRLW